MRPRISRAHCGKTLAAFSLMVVAACHGTNDAGPVSEGDKIAADTSAFEVSHVGSYSGFEAGDSSNAKVGLVAGYYAILLSPDLAAVANRDNVLLYNAASGKATTVGRRGAGPGEFYSVRQVFHADGGFLATDTRDYAASLFLTTGALNRHAQVKPGITIGWLSQMGPITRKGGISSPFIYTLHDTSGFMLRELAEVPAFPKLSASLVGEDGNTYMSPQCDPPVLDAVIGDRLYIADQVNGSIVAVAKDGSSRTIFRSRRKGTVTPAIVAKVRKLYARASREDLENLLSNFGSVGSPLVITWDSMIPDPNGKIWLRTTSCINNGARLWEVIDTSGAYHGTLKSDLHVVAAWADRLLSRGEDSNGVPVLSLWRLSRQ